MGQIVEDKGLKKVVLRAQVRSESCSYRSSNAYQSFIPC